jgi:hypothetical protein
MTEIKWVHFGKDNFACVDADDWDKVKGVVWKGTFGYAWFIQHKRKPVRMSHLILKYPDPAKVIDHINRCRWDNRKCNLREVTQKENRANTGIPDISVIPSALGMEAAILHRKYLIEQNIFNKIQDSRQVEYVQGLRKAVINNKGESFVSTAEAARSLGLNQAHISDCCTGKRRICGGLTWEFDSTRENTILPRKLKIPAANSVPREFKPVANSKGEYFKSSLAAATHYKTQQTGIAYCCKGEAATCCGLTWRYANDTEILWLLLQKEEIIKEIME